MLGLPAKTGSRFSQLRHGHVAFVVTVATRYHVKWYSDRPVHTARIGSGIDHWTDEELSLAIEEGRRQAADQVQKLQSVISRASALLPVGLVLSGFFLSGFDSIDELPEPRETITRLLLGLGALACFWGTATMGALIGGRSNLGAMDLTSLTQQNFLIRRKVARRYAELVTVGINSSAARLTILGTGVTWIIGGAGLGLLGLLLLHWEPFEFLG